MLAFLKKLFRTAREGPPPEPPREGRFGIHELARRLGVAEFELTNVPITYRRFEIPKRGGRGTRVILAPDAPLKALQRTILRRLLRRLRAHVCATGFERRHSIVTNALTHVDKDVVIKLDVRDFFTSTGADRVERYFRFVGWNNDAAALLKKLCTHEGALPQGAPTSPRLSNLVNYELDERLAEMARMRGVSYSRYADDITFSANDRAPVVDHPGPTASECTIEGGRINDLVHATKAFLADYGYTLHTDKKLRVARRGDRQLVTGIVVNVKANLPRATRRRLRAIEHRLKTRGQATLTPAQLAGWRALDAMVRTQREAT